MSCGVCLMPFVAARSSLDPRPVPPGILSDSMKEYYSWGTSINYKPQGVISTVEYLDRNLFRAKTIMPINMMQTWESPESGTIDLVCHIVCARILRRMFGAENDDTQDHATLVEMVHVLGRPLGGRFYGKVPSVDYLATTEVIDMDRYWTETAQLGEQEFAWARFKGDSNEWMYNKPDVFPKFHNQVSKKRMASVAGPCKSGDDIITRQSIDIIQVLLPYLPMGSFVAFLSTCRSLRRHAHTTFQGEARRRIYGLGWATPFEQELKAAGDARSMMARPNAPEGSDWLRYLGQVHNSKSIRVRRRIWELSRVMKEKYELLRQTSQFAEVINENGEQIKSEARRLLEEEVGETKTISRMLAGGYSREEMLQMQKDLSSKMGPLDRHGWPASMGMRSHPL